MKFIKESTRANPKVSLILLDWSVRESFHLLHYLSQQDVPRDLFEVVVIEYYSRTSDAVKRFVNQLDTWVLLEMPKECYYHKHLMYNAGIVLSRGEICVICDSDAMVESRFIRAIVDAFESDPHIVLHIDQFRNMRRDFYPFNYPSFEQVTGRGCINFVDGKTRGIADRDDPIHTRNYGACMCARKEDLLAIGGADEHVDYVGHICGPYDMTFRLVNSGKRERWHATQFMYHTWHPGQAGVGNYLGPHDGRHLSTTALTAFCTGRRLPYLENPAIRRLRTGITAEHGCHYQALIDPVRTRQWHCESYERKESKQHDLPERWQLMEYLGFLIERKANGQCAAQLLADYADRPGVESSTCFEAASLEEAQRHIERITPSALRVFLILVGAYVSAAQIAACALRFLGERFARMARWRRAEAG